MPRYTLQAWWCWRNHRNTGDQKKCAACGALRIEKHAQVHASERSVVYYNPLTGEHRTPMRNDQPVPEVYVQQGYERREILNMTKWEKEAGVVHEASNFSPGNEVAAMREPEVPTAPKEVIDQLAKDWADAAASGPFTTNDNDDRAFSIAAPL